MVAEGTDVRREMLKEALLVRSQQELHVGAPIYVALLAALAVLSPPLAVVWAVVGGVAGIGLLVRAAQGMLADEATARRVAEQVVRRSYAAQRVPPELEPYVEQSIESAVNVIVQTLQARGTPSHPALVEVSETVTELLARIQTLCAQVVRAEDLLNTIKERFRALPQARATAPGTDFDRNLRQLQQTIDEARQQIFQTASLLQHMAVQALLIQTGDFALIDATVGDLRQTAQDQSALLQTRIDAMRDVADTTEAATAPLVARYGSGI